MYKEPNPTLYQVGSDVTKPSPKKHKTAVRNEFTAVHTKFKKNHGSKKTRLVTAVMPVFSVSYILFWSFHEMLKLGFTLDSKSVKFSKFSLTIHLKKLEICFIGSVWLIPPNTFLPQEIRVKHQWDHLEWNKKFSNH